MTQDLNPPFEQPENLNIIDQQGYRLNIGIIVINQNNQVLWAQRYNQRAWQFPQGGVQKGEKLIQALYRELHEELGLQPEDVIIEDSTPGFLSYKLPARLIRHDNHPLCIGQKQKWFLLRLISDDSAIKLDSSVKPEFQGWSWVPYWYPLRYVVSFKRDVYRKALKHFSLALFPQEVPYKLDPFCVEIQPRTHGRPSDVTPPAGASPSSDDSLS